MKEATLQDHKMRMLRALVRIQECLDEPLPWPELAKLAGLAPHHFHHVFTGMVGESVASHIRRLRLERAAMRLKTSRARVLEIALEAGYESHEAFTRAFGGAFGMAPGAFRKRHGLEAELRAASGIHFQEARARALTHFRAKKTGGKAMKVTIQHFKPMRVAFLRQVGGYDKAGETWERFLMLLGKEGWIGGEARFIGLCHDDPAVTPAGRIRYDACMTVDQTFRPWGEIGSQVIAGGDYAVMTHVGPYQRLGKSYAKLLGQWLPRSGRRLRAGPSFEVYLNSPESTAPKDLLTDICAPLE